MRRSAAAWARGHREVVAALATGAAAAGFVLLAVAPTALKGDLRPPEGMAELRAVNHFDPLLGPLGLPGPLLMGALVAGVAWVAARWAAPARGPQAALLSGAAAALLLWGDLRWLTAYDSLYPFVVEAVAEWGPRAAAPQFGVVVALVTRFALAPLGRDAPMRARSAMLAAAAAMVPMAVVSPVLWNLDLQFTGVGYETFRIYWMAEVGMPTIALVVGTTAWLTAGRALRPVEAIRRGLAELSVRSLDRRVPVPRSGDELTKLAVTTNEILDRLEHSAELQRRFVGDASHELRSPIANLRASLEGSLAHPAGVHWPQVVREAVGDIERLQRLTDDLLLLNRLDSGPGAPAGRSAGGPVDLTGLVLDLVEEYRHLPRAARLRISSEIDGRAEVVGSAVQLERLMRNLVDNACRHADRAVAVRLAVEDGAVRLEVRDDGPGIPEADRERVFERFTRLDDARTRAVGGSGLGLPIAREIATGHGGTLVVAPGEGGAVLTVLLPSGS